MRRSTSRLWLLLLCLLAPAVFAASTTRAAVPPTDAEAVAHEGGPRPATKAERERYREREQQAAGLEEFEGGRVGGVAASTIIIILLVVIIVIIVV